LEQVNIIGGGLAGSEAAWQLVRRNIPVNIYEMRPYKQTPAHKTGDFAELVCSNSLRAQGLTNAVGLLKEEMRRLDSLIMNCADYHSLPAGGALAVDREAFAQSVTRRLAEHPLVTIHRQEITQLPSEGITILATGPLTSPALTEHLMQITNMEQLYFYDAAAPIVTVESLDMAEGFWGSRYDKGDKDYFNCPMTKEQYMDFYEALISAKVTPARDFEKEIFFEGCMPVEVLASRGPQTLLFGPLKPVGLQDPRKQQRPFAVVQLRQDDGAGTLMNMVGFQTRLTRPEQQRVFRMIPGLAQAEFVRYGMVHRNTFLNSPELLLQTGQLKKMPKVLVAGQVSGVEGYVESAASGLAAGINASRLALGKEPIIFPEEMALGSLLRYIVNTAAKNFQPMNVNFGLLSALDNPPRDKKMKNECLVKRALDKTEQLKQTI
jgi:methylenetetrahydrofolate--tRNA-(uracil-5-)-methyltransferase